MVIIIITKHRILKAKPTRTKIDPARILDVQEDVRKSYDGESGNESVDYSGFKIQVKDDPRTELVNKNTNDPVYDIELHNEWRDDPSAYNLMGRSGSDIVTIDPNRGFDRIHTNYGVRGAADLSFQMIPDGQGGEIPFILPIYRSTKTDLTPLVFLASAFLGPWPEQLASHWVLPGLLRRQLVPVSSLRERNLLLTARLIRAGCWHLPQPQA
jgi:hypothetical protein